MCVCVRDIVIPSDNFYIIYLFCILKVNSEIRIEQNKTETHTENKLRVGRWEGVGGWMKKVKTGTGM